MKTSASLLRYARRRAGLTQRELAERAGVAQSAIARVEAGRVSPSADRLARFVELCGLRLSAEPPAGQGVDRTAIRELLRLTPAERLALAAREASNLEALERRASREPAR